MPNRVRPRCPRCGAAARNVYRKGARGKAFVKIRGAFTCCERLARGRRQTRWL